MKQFQKMIFPLKWGISCTSENQKFKKDHYFCRCNKGNVKSVTGNKLLINAAVFFLFSAGKYWRRITK